MWGFLPAIVVIVIYIIVYTVYILLWVGKDEPGVHITKIPMFNKKLKSKYAHYRHKGITWMVLYMNLVMPAICLMRINDIVVSLASPTDVSVLFLFNFAFALSSLICIFVIRAIDDIGFWVNIVTLCIWAITIFAPVFTSDIPVFTITASCFSILIWIVPNMIYFFKRKELFIKTVEELDDEYGTPRET